jgi:hypothetical protein
MTNWPFVHQQHDKFHRDKVQHPSVPSDGFQPPSQQALSGDRGSEPSAPHTIQPLKAHRLDGLLYHLFCWLLVASTGQHWPVRTPHAIPCSLPIPQSKNCTSYLAYPFQIQQAFGYFSQAIPGITQRKGRKRNIRVMETARFSNGCSSSQYRY